jgi:Mn2+/Fe2+ NRAMP family transporter
MFFSYPLMTAMQEISARIGRVTGIGIAGNMRKHHSRILLYPVVFLLCLASIFNLGADLGAMGAATQLLFGGPATPYLLFFAVVSLVLQMYVRYTTYVKYLKWLTLAVFAYVFAAFVVHVSWREVLGATLVPSLAFDGKYFATLTAVLGTTISPYLFFWQASQEAEEVRVNQKEQALKKSPHQAEQQFDRIRVDTYFGMGISNLVAFFVILTTAATLHRTGVFDVQTSAQAAKALEPVAGRFAFFYSRPGLLARDCSQCRFLPGRLHMVWQKLLSGVPVCKANPIRRGSFTASLQRPRSSVWDSISLRSIQFGRSFGQPSSTASWQFR